MSQFACGQAVAIQTSATLQADSPSAPLATPQTPEQFVANWSKSSGHEDKVDRQFFLELCDLLDVPKPSPVNEAQESYCFQKAVKITHPDGAETTKKIDFYKRAHFVIEAKQGSDAGDKSKGTARRGTEGWKGAMRAAFAQGHEYAINLPEGRPPFLVTCDIGHIFEVWSGFSGSYGGYGASKRIPFGDLVHEETRAFLRAVFLDPHSLNPALRAAKVTREVAIHLATLAKELEPTYGAERTAAFLMRCIFTMFAEDVGLLAGEPFTKAIAEHWIVDPAAFPEGVSDLWKAMDQGLRFGFTKLLRFNGGLFASTEALPLTKAQLSELLAASKREWSAVEPTIFGTLVESALYERDRARLGAHFTPREYIERLIRPAMLEPLRGDFALALGESRLMMAEAAVDGAGNPREPTKAERAAAADVLTKFHAKLCKVKVLDPACGSGNFLYVSFALLKELEAEVLRELADLGQASGRLDLESVSVNPSQFLGIEKNPRAREIADLVLWIGYLQWHRKTRSDVPPVEPILRQYKNIVQGDAVLASDTPTPKLGEDGEHLTVWDMRTYVESAVTGELIPSAAADAQVGLYDYANPCAVEWPDADFIVSNPPFCGNKPMRKALGDSYTEALRSVYKQVPQTADLVMYWWEKAAASVRAGKARRFGLITTNSITQKFNRGVIEAHTGAKKDPLAVTFAIADHPWVVSGAAVRIAMTVGARAAEANGQAVLATVAAEERGDGVESLAQRVEVATKGVAAIHSDLTGGANVAAAIPLRANTGISFQGMNLVGEGFRLTGTELRQFGYPPDSLPSVVKPYMNARDLTQGADQRWVIDLFGMTAEQVRERHPALYQRVVDRVKVERDHNKRDSRRKNWWLFGEPVGKLRTALKGLKRYIVTPETSKHRFFVFAPMELLPDHKLYAIASDDAFVFGVLSSRLQTVWALAAGGWLGVGNDPVWSNTTCLGHFPFPGATEAQISRIRNLAEKLDAHRKSVLTGGFLAARAPGPISVLADSAVDVPVTFTGMYNALQRLREAESGGKPLHYAERAFHDRALIGVLRSLHDDLDAAVAEAYGWDAKLADEATLEKLVALNAERASEEKGGTIRWLRPDLQNPSGAATATKASEQVSLLPDDDTEYEGTTKLAWPKEVPAQLKAIRDAVMSKPGAWTAATVARWFHKAQQRIVERHLRTLHDVGALSSYDDGKGRRWSAQAAGAA